MKKIEILKSRDHLVWLEFDGYELVYSYGKLVLIKDSTTVYIEEKYYHCSEIIYYRHIREFLGMNSNQIENAINLNDGTFEICDLEEILEEL